MSDVKSTVLYNAYKGIVNICGSCGRSNGKGQNLCLYSKYEEAMK